MAMNNCEIDALVAEKVMGWELSEHAHSQDKWYYRKNGQIFGMAKFVKDWNPSTNISDAWQVVEKLKQKGIFVRLYVCPDAYAAEWFMGSEEKFVKAEQAPVAICLAALNAVGASGGNA